MSSEPWTPPKHSVCGSTWPAKGYSRPGATALQGGGLSSCGRRLPTAKLAISLYADIGQGAGLAGASGVRPFLPTLLAGAMARGDVLIDFDGSGWQFLESPGFLLAVFGLALLWYGAERSGANRGLVDRAVLGLGLVLGALLFAGSLAAGNEAAWPGLVGGVACALLGRAALGGLFERAARRLEKEATNLLSLYAEGAALMLAAVAIVVPPLSYLALAGFVLLLVRGGRADDRKYAGLRVLR
ncbi:MAG TPA: DUF4126 family protein [Thermoleophilaceae bacterium]|nr:DUF4126 family protein [Thermoleophilaceae bacterium]